MIKPFLLVTALILLPFLAIGQSSPPVYKVIEKTLDNVQIGMPLADFLKTHPTATVSDEVGSYTENGVHKDIKKIIYYFGSNGKQPFYEVIVELATSEVQSKVTQHFFGTFNHPVVANHWVIYKGNKDFLTAGWTYENKFIYAGKVPDTRYFDGDFFDIDANFNDLDIRINKKSNAHFIGNKIIKPESEEVKPQKEDVKPNNGFYTAEDYGKALETVFEANVKLKMGGDSLKIILPKVKLDKNSPDFRNEYLLQINESGLKEVSFYTTKKGNKPLYQVIFEFENADTVLHLAELMFPNNAHPVLDNHWVLGIGDKMENGNYLVSMARVYENRLIIAVNLPTSELEEEESFKLSDDFIAEYFKKEGIEPTPKPANNNDNPSDNEATSLTVNKLIAAAINDFADNKTDLMPNKKEEYDASAFATLGQEQAVIRKNAAGKWRLELRFPTYESADAAKEAVDDTVKFYQTLEGLEYRLVKKTDLTTTNGRTYIWDIHNLDDAETGVILKWQTYPTSNGQFGVKMELGK